MSMSQGPSPEELLEGIKLEEAQRHQGRLKIFLGMAAGVGKTHTMLEEAQALKKEQINVVVGLIEAHERSELEVLMKDLPQIPKKTLFYKDKELTEMDVDAIISLNPSVVLVDELAHTNFPGSKNEKRWQDVQELLDHGINVHTTLNVQHIDSLKDIILGIAEVAVRETVPDIMIEKADSIQLIDLTPDELLQRFKDGKVYTEEQSKIASLHFFQKNKLTALRELALRYVADKVDVDLMRTITTKEGRVEWHTREKFLVAISESIHSQKLIKATRRLATQANAPWVALHVNTGKTLTQDEEEQLEKTFLFTRGLGAEVVTIQDPDIAEGIKRIAYQRDITQIVLGRTARDSILSFYQGPTLVDKLIAECKNIDLYVIRQDKYIVSCPARWLSYLERFKFSEYLSVSFLVCVIAALCSAALFLIDYRIVEFLFFIGISILSVFFKRGPAILAAILFGILWGYFFIPFSAESSFSVLNEGVLLVLYVLTALFFGIYVGEAWGQKKWVGKSDKKASELAEILRCLERGLPLNEILICLEARLPCVVKGVYKFVIKNNKGSLDLDDVSLLSESKDRMTASWVFDNGREAGWSTETLSLSENLYMPLKGPQEIMGILIFRSPDKKMMSKEDQNLIYTLCCQLANYLEASIGRGKSNS